MKEKGIFKKATKLPEPEPGKVVAVPIDEWPAYREKHQVEMDHVEFPAWGSAKSWEQVTLVFVKFKKSIHEGHGR